jgi:hypothetical protein
LIEVFNKRFIELEEKYKDEMNTKYDQMVIDYDNYKANKTETNQYFTEMQ